MQCTVFPFFFTSIYLQIATAFSDMYSVYILDASHNLLQADNKMAVTFFERNFSRINLV